MPAVMLPIAQYWKRQKCQYATVATNPKVTVLDGKVKPFNFRVCFIDPYQGAVAAGYGYDVLGLGKLQYFMILQMIIHRD